MAETKKEPTPLEVAQARIAQLEKENAEWRELERINREGWDESHTTQWTGLNQEESGRKSSEKARRKFMTHEEFRRRDEDWINRGMPGPNDFRGQIPGAQLREFDAKTGVEIGADPRLAARTVAPSRVGGTVDESREPA